MIYLDLRRQKGFKRFFDLGEWELYFSRKPLYLKEKKIKRQCLAYIDFDKNQIYVYSKQTLAEIKNSLRHELLHIVDFFREEQKIEGEEIIYLQEALIVIADDIVEKWLAEEL